MVETRAHVSGLRRLGEIESWAIVDDAIRKEISWSEARARLVALYELQLELEEELELELDYPQ